MTKRKKRLRIRAFLRQKFSGLRSRLQSERSKDILTFLLFVALSFLFWMMQSLGEDMNTVYRIPIKYTNIPDNTIITCDLPTSVTVHLRDGDKKPYLEKLAQHDQPDIAIARHIGGLLHPGAREKGQGAY